MDCGYAIYKAGSSDEPACVELTNKIKGSMYKVAKEFVYIGFLLAECDYYETYKEWGYSSIHEYASDQLGFKKSSTYNFINVCKAFCNPTETLPFSYFVKDSYTNFNYSQLVEMLSMNDKQRSQVTSDMTVKQIREVKMSFHEPEYTKLYYMQFNFQKFREVYHRKINGKKFQLTVSGHKCKPSDIRPDGYIVSFHYGILNDCGRGCGYNRIVDYKEFVDLVLRFWNFYSQSDDSRCLESVLKESPTLDAPEETSAPSWVPVFRVNGWHMVCSCCGARWMLDSVQHMCIQTPYCYNCGVKLKSVPTHKIVSKSHK